MKKYLIIAIDFTGDGGLEGGASPEPSPFSGSVVPDTLPLYASVQVQYILFSTLFFTLFSELVYTETNCIWIFSVTYRREKYLIKHIQ